MFHSVSSARRQFRSRAFQLFARFIFLSVIALPGYADPITKQGLHITNPPVDQGGPGTIHDIHVFFSGKWTSPDGKKDPPKLTGGSGDWVGSAGPMDNQLNYEGGTLTGGNTVDIGRLNVDRPAGVKAIVTRVEFTDDNGAVVNTLILADNEKRFKKFVKGFTNDEFFDFSDPANTRFVMPGAPELRYTLDDLKIFTDVTDPFDLTSGALAFSASEFFIEPGTTASILVGPMHVGSAFASIGAITVQDLVIGDVITAATPQLYGEPVPVIEPATLMLLLIALAALLIVREKRRVIGWGSVSMSFTDVGGALCQAATV